MKTPRLQKAICTFCGKQSENPYYCPTCDTPAPYQSHRVTVDRRFTVKPLRRQKGRP